MFSFFTAKEANDAVPDVIKKFEYSLAKKNDITKIEKDSPLLSSIEINSIILEAQKKKIRTANDLNLAVRQVLNSNQKTILLVIYNSQNQRRYIGVKLD